MAAPEEVHTINFHLDDEYGSDSEVSRSGRRSSARAPAPNVEQPGSAPDVDVEETGQGFFNRQATLSVLRTQPVEAAATTAAPANTKGQVEIEMAEQRGLLGAGGDRTTAGVASTQEERKTQPDDVIVPLQRQLSPGAKPPSSDSLWLISLDEVAARFPDSDLDPVNTRQSGGLTSAKAAELLAKNGRNELKPPAEHSELVKYLLCYTDPFMILLGSYETQTDRAQANSNESSGLRVLFDSVCCLVQFSPVSCLPPLPTPSTRLRH